MQRDASLTLAVAGFMAMVSATRPVLAEQRSKDKGGWLTWDRATGDWGGARTRLEEHGVDLSFGFTAVWQANHRGGLRSRPEGKLASSWDLEVTLDTERLGLWPGGTFVVYLEGSKGTGIHERYVGSFFRTDDGADTTADHRLQFSEYWYEHTFGERLLSVRIGKMDAARDFFTNAFACDETTQFLNAAFVNMTNPTVPLPDYALGAQAFVRPGGGFYFGAGAFDANAEGWTSGLDTALKSDSDWFVIAEAGVEVGIPTAAQTKLPGNYRIGAWHDPRRYERIDNARSSKGESGWYVSLDQMLYKESPDGEDPQGLGLFARYGYAPDQYSEVEHFWSIGAQYQGLVPSRDGDVLGLGFAQGKLGQPTRRQSPHDHETVYECYYNIAVGGGVSFTLDLQYLKHPGARQTSSLVPGIRFQAEF